MVVTIDDQKHITRINYNFGNLKKYIDMTEGFLLRVLRRFRWNYI